MNYQTSKSITGADPQQTLKFIAGILTAAGFTIHEWKENNLTATGPAMMNTKQNPLRAVTRIAIQVQGRNLSAEAEVGAKKLISILSVVFSCMTVGFILMGCFLPAHDRHGQAITTGTRIFICVAPLIPLVIVLPIFYRISIAMGRRAVDNLLHNAAIMPG